MDGLSRQMPTRSAPSSRALALTRAVMAARSVTSTRCGFTGPSRNLAFSVHRLTYPTTNSERLA